MCIVFSLVRFVLRVWIMIWCFFSVDMFIMGFVLLSGLEVIVVVRFVRVRFWRSLKRFLKKLLRDLSQESGESDRKKWNKLSMGLRLRFIS